MKRETNIYHACWKRLKVLKTFPFSSSWLSPFSPQNTAIVLLSNGCTLPIVEGDKHWECQIAGMPDCEGDKDWECQIAERTRTCWRTSSQWLPVVRTARQRLPADGQYSLTLGLENTPVPISVRTNAVGSLSTCICTHAKTTPSGKRVANEPIRSPEACAC